MVMTTFITDLTSDSVTDKELVKLIKDINLIKYIKKK